MARVSRDNDMIFSKSDGGYLAVRATEAARSRREPAKMRVGRVCVRRDRKAMQTKVGAKQRMITVSGSIGFFHALQKIQRASHDFGNGYSAKDDLPRRKRGNTAG